jgi:hypothetical protein
MGSIFYNTVNTSLLKSPSLFPFQIARVYPEQPAGSGRLDVVRHGVENVLVRVRQGGGSGGKPKFGGQPQN